MQSDAGPPVSVFQKPSFDEDSKLLPSDDVVQVAPHHGIAIQDIESDFQTLQIGFRCRFDTFTGMHRLTSGHLQQAWSAAGLKKGEIFIFEIEY